MPSDRPTIASAPAGSSPCDDCRHDQANCPREAGLPVEPLAGTRERILGTVYRWRVALLALAVFAAMAALNPRQFLTAGNFQDIFRATSTDVLAAAGFTIVMICGQLDLSIGMTMTMGGISVMLLQPHLGWTGAMLATSGVGCAIGLFNGLLVTKAKVNSFIVTLGTLTILQGVSRRLLQAGSLSLGEAGEPASQLLKAVQLWSPRVLLIFGPALLLELILRYTAMGRAVYLIGGNRQTAWYAGLRTDRYVTGAFVLSGVLSALGGALSAISQNTAMQNLGDSSLMMIVAAVIVGGTSMSGGRGSIAMGIVALVALNALTNGLNDLGADRSVKLIANGAVLAVIIVYDAWRTVLKNRVRGQRRELLAEWKRVEADVARAEESHGSEAMQTQDRTFGIVCVTAMACVAIVAIFAMTLRQQQTVMVAPGAGGVLPGGAAQPAEVDLATLKGTDNQPLVFMDDTPLHPPVRPAEPAKLPDDDLLRWYDFEYSGWDVQKLPMPASPGDGPRGKKIVSLQYIDHPYWTGYNNGMRRAAKAYGIELKIMEAGNNNKAQADQVEQVIRMRPDLVIITPVDPNGAVPMLKRLHEEKVPTIASNLLPVNDGMKYVITWTGPDDWGQFRMLAREFARQMNNQGGYCIVQHVKNASCFLSRTWAPVSELKKIAPNMKCLDMQSTDLKTEETKVQVAAWLKKYGTELKGIISADDSNAAVGIVEALKDAGRSDVIVVSAGTSRTGLEYIKAGRLHAVTYQSAEGDGALPIYVAAQWFSGRKIDRPVYYLRKHVITKRDVEEFSPAQW